MMEKDETRENMADDEAETFYRRCLPSPPAIDFTSPDGKVSCVNFNAIYLHIFSYIYIYMFNKRIEGACLVVFVFLKLCKRVPYGANYELLR